MRLATAPVFHPSEFARQRITTETVKGAVAQILAQQSEGSPVTDLHGPAEFLPVLSSWLCSFSRLSHAGGRPASGLRPTTRQTATRSPRSSIQVGRS